MRKSETTLLDKGKTQFRPRARLMRAIGEELISSPIVALVELVKNSYDADASEVCIRFEGPLGKAGRGTIKVTDDGHGMNLKVLRRAWFEPANPEKKNQRLSPSGRRMTGEKGIGRFAAARLANRMHLESTTATPPRRVSANVKWSDFDSASRYLDQVHCSWAVHKVPPGSAPGTSLQLKGLKDTWDEESLRELRTALSRLLARERDLKFGIILELPTELEESCGGKVQPPGVLEHPHYSFRGNVDESGLLRGSLSIGGADEAIEENLVLDDRAPSCGPFSFEIRVWDRDDLERLSDQLESTKSDLKRDLDDASGMSIYRDDFRVLPYGNRGDDWLRLDHRRIQNPTLRLSNNQIAGAIHITADRNPGLHDQTNREGIRDSRQFSDLRRCVVELISRVESRRYKNRRPETQKSRGSLVEQFEQFKLEPLRKRFAERYPADTEFQSYLDDRATQVRQSIKKVQDVVSRYRRLGALGMLVDVLLHDGRTPIASMRNELELAERDAKRAAKDPTAAGAKLLGRVAIMRSQLEVLSGLLQRLAPFGGRKRGRPQELPIERMIRDVFALFEGQIHKLGVRTVLPETETRVTADPGEMQQIFMNLLDNALYWLQKVPRERRAIDVSVSRENENLVISFTDSGPGVSSDARTTIFDPYLSTKPDGVGLGLTIAGEIAAEYGGTIELMDECLLGGAHFRVVLSRRVGEASDDGGDSDD